MDSRSLFGVGLRSVHYPNIVDQPRTDAGWFEALTENYMDSKGRPLRVLTQVRQNYPVALHGVSMSLGSAFTERENQHLNRLKALADRIQPLIISDHLCWTGTPEHNVHDLLPLPFTEASLKNAVRNIDRVQMHLGRTIAVENVSSYLTYRDSVYSEWEFLKEVSRRSGCGILLDINNIYVSSVNHRFNAMEYLRSIPPSMVSQIHLAGHADMDDFLFDTHSKEVAPAVWELYSEMAVPLRDVPVLIEWDEEIPPFEGLLAEMRKARSIWEQRNGT